MAVVVLILAVLTLKKPHFWSKPDRHGDILFHQKHFADAAKAYEDPWRIATAQYRNGDFEAAARTFARVPGASGAYDQGNAWLMHGQYEAAIASYDRALTFKPGWKEAQENKALALARKQKMDASGKDRDKEQTGQDDKPDKIVFDQKGEDKKGQPIEINEAKKDDTQLRESWLRRVQTKPGDFLQAKFAYQAAHVEQENSKPAKEDPK
jgi:Ca-activated chloride channel family protein